MNDTKAATPLSLGAEFPEAERADWLELVEKSLRGVPFEKALVRRTYEGIERQPLYTSADRAAAPSAARPTIDAARVSDGWDIRQVHTHPDPAIANKAILSDLERGVTSVVLRFDSSVRSAGDTSATGDGIIAPDVDQLDRVLEGVHLHMAPVALLPGAAFMPVAASLMALWRRRGVAAGDPRGNLGADPLGVLARGETLFDGIEASLARMAELALHVDTNHPGVRAISIDAGPYYEAGANEAQDLACAMATGVAYLRALTAAGLSLQSACTQMQFTLSLGVDVFPAIAKLRAARRLWARIIEASGGDPASAPMLLHASTAKRVMAKRDAWVNMLRTTVAAFAGAVGGADSLTVLPYSQAAGQPEEFARRIARNTQLILMEESSLNRVADPAGGSWFAETLTDQLAEAAWAEFQAIESAGGMADALTSSGIAKKLATSWAERERDLARRRTSLTGVSSYPNLDEAPAETQAFEIDGLPGPRTDAPTPSGKSTDALIAAADAGADITSLASVERGSPVSVQAPVRHRLAEAFEALRDASDDYQHRTGQRPRVFLANLGTAADYTARTTFCKSYVEAGGLQAMAEEVTADTAAAAFTLSGAGLALICSSDKIYDASAEAVAKALIAADAKSVVLAGKPGDQEARWREAGIDRFIFAGDDALATLRDLAQCLGVIEMGVIEN